MSQDDENWWYGSNENKELGFFPASYVNVGAKAVAVALYEYKAEESNEISFSANDTIKSIEFMDDDWWVGDCNGSYGLFPSNYVKIIGRE
jgi:hypothetical protein